MIADILFLTKDKAIGTFSNVLVSSPNLYTSCNKLSSSNEKCSSGILIFPSSSVEPIPKRNSKKSS